MDKKIKKNQRVWFINFGGIGNGAMIIPILKCFESSLPSTKYYSTENDLLSTNWFLRQAKIENLVDLTPALWRRFDKEKWPEIINFIMRNKIAVIVNLRNEGPKYDSDYYNFKKYCKKFYKNIDFYDLNFDNIEKRIKKKNLVEDIKIMIEKLGVDFSNYNQTWLQKVRNKINNHKVGLCLASSQSNKCWSYKKWLTLAKLLNKGGYYLVIFPGKDEVSYKEAEKIKNKFKSNCEIFSSNLVNASRKISMLECFISNDTGLLHIATAIGVPSIGIYTNTEPDIWKPYCNKNFYSFTNYNMFKCNERKTISGNCQHYYEICPAIKKYPDNIEASKVYKQVKIFTN